MQSDEISRLINTSRSAAEVLRNYCQYLPRFEVEYDIKPIAQTILKLSVRIRPDWLYSSRWHMRSEPFLIYVDNEEELLHHEEFLITQK